MIWLPIGIAAAAALGGANFLGGRAARQGFPPIGVTLVNFCGSIGLLGGLLLVTRPPFPGTGSVVAAALGGLVSATATVLLYRSLRLGQMSVNAPVMGVTSILVATVAGAYRGETLHLLAWIGLILAAVAIFATSQAPGASHHGRKRTDGLPEAVGAGVGFGLFSVFLSLSEAGAAETLMVARLASVAILLVFAVPSLRRVSPSPLVRAGLPVSGLEFLGNICMFTALAIGSLPVVQALIALNPVVTVLLARMDYGEHLNMWQRIGAIAALTSIPLLALG